MRVVLHKAVFGNKYEFEPSYFYQVLSLQTLKLQIQKLHMATIDCSCGVKIYISKVFSNSLILKACRKFPSKSLVPGRGVQRPVTRVRKEGGCSTVAAPPSVQIHSELSKADISQAPHRFQQLCACMILWICAKSGGGMVWGSSVYICAGFMLWVQQFSSEPISEVCALQQWTNSEVNTFSSVHNSAVGPLQQCAHFSSVRTWVTRDPCCPFSHSRMLPTASCSPIAPSLLIWEEFSTAAGRV